MRKFEFTYSPNFIIRLFFITPSIFSIKGVGGNIKVRVPIRMKQLPNEHRLAASPSRITKDRVRAEADITVALTGLVAVIRLNKSNAGKGWHACSSHT